LQISHTILGLAGKAHLKTETSSASHDFRTRNPG